jgi:hypothetical protein
MEGDMMIQILLFLTEAITEPIVSAVLYSQRSKISAMKYVFWLMGLLAVMYFMSAFTQSTRGVDGSSPRAAANSVKKLKRYMTTQQQHIFETSYGVLGAIKSKEGPDAFLPFVDGKSPDEVIELAREEVAKRIAAGDPDLVKYGSWENLVGLGAAPSPGKDNKPSGVQPLRSSERSSRDITPAATAQPAH